MADTILDPEILQAFQCDGREHALSGGEGRSIRVERCVFKPIENAQRYSWSCDLLMQLPRMGFRIAEPRRALDGSFVYRGWAASIFEPGQPVHGRWGEKLGIARLFHSALNDLALSPMPPSDDRWSRAHEIAWGHVPLPKALHPEIVRTIEGIFASYQPLARAGGIIHSDLCGNILFQDGLDPCVIDFSPAYGSPEYAESILVADAIAWEGAPLDILNLLPLDERYRQLLLRAINFRVIVTALFSPQDVERFFIEYAAFERLLEVVSA
jgi:uncharacterized protein (TIGR02569 family)